MSDAEIVARWLPTAHSYAQVSVTLKDIMQDFIWLTWCYLKIEISVVLGGAFALQFMQVPTIPFSFHLYSLLIYATCLVSADGSTGPKGLGNTVMIL